MYSISKATSLRHVLSGPCKSQLEWCRPLAWGGEPFCRGDRQFERVHHQPHREQVEPCEALGSQAHGRTPSASLKQRDVDQASEWISLAQDRGAWPHLGLGPYVVCAADRGYGHVAIIFPDLGTRPVRRCAHTWHRVYLHLSHSCRCMRSSELETLSNDSRYLSESRHCSNLQSYRFKLGRRPQRQHSDGNDGPFSVERAWRCLLSAWPWEKEVSFGCGVLLCQRACHSAWELDHG